MPTYHWRPALLVSKMRMRLAADTAGQRTDKLLGKDTCMACPVRLMSLPAILRYSGRYPS